ncbi:hypothetical protein [Chitinilyticum aquatile]|uniref:hypothetical protein n=1 Tax=Chitinilyticum aquatile TaxID=362520 RepID=UPI000412B050|nr:hypothetical protein [Chitinilyticum aquatile]
MVPSGIFVDVLLPACIIGSLGGFLLYVLLSRLLYDYVDEHYHDMLPKIRTSIYVDPDDVGAYMATIWAITRTGQYRRVESTFWRRLFVVNGIVGLILALSLLTICAAFIV